jgi:hypothetical protein
MDEMDAESLKAIAARDQFWASLRTLLPEIERLSTGTLSGTLREQELVQLLARVVLAELRFRAEFSGPE